MNQFQQWGPAAVIVPGYIIGLYFQGRQIDSLRNEMNARFEIINEKIASLRVEMNAKFEARRESLLRVEGVLDARLKHLEDRER